MDEFNACYVVLMSDGLGNDIFGSDRIRWLTKMGDLLEGKYGKEDYRTRFLRLCLMKEQTHEFDVQDQEWVRYIFHQETEPNDDHTSLLEDLKKRMETKNDQETSTLSQEQKGTQ